MQSLLFRLRLPLFLLAFLVAGFWNLDGPPSWWDEGWTLSVARNVAEHGVYARLRDGQLVANGLEAAIPVTEMVAFSFRIFGVGLWQGRVPSVLMATLALAMLFLLARRLYNEPVAWGALVAALLLGNIALNPLIQGRQAMAELPMLAVLLAGFLFLDQATRKTIWYTIPCWIFLAIAATLKSQTLPFLMVSLGFGVLTAILLRRWRTMFILISSLIIIVPLQIALYQGFYFLAHPPFPAEQLVGLTQTVALVFELGNRRFALSSWFGYAIPATFGACITLWSIWQGRSLVVGDQAEVLVLQATLAGFVLSWMAWFLVLAAGWIRYLLPPVFVGAIFASAFIYQLSNQYNLYGIMQLLIETLRTRHFSRASARAWLATLLFVITIALGIRTLLNGYVLGTNQTAQQVAAFLNQTPADTVVETYETELHFMLNRRYHWPDDQIHVALDRYMLSGERTSFAYDPLAANPDYLVVGGFARTTGLYDEVLRTGAFRLQMTAGEYEVYQRVR